MLEGLVFVVPLLPPTLALTPGVSTRTHTSDVFESDCNTPGVSVRAVALDVTAEIVTPEVATCAVSAHVTAGAISPGVTAGAISPDVTAGAVTPNVSLSLSVLLMNGIAWDL